MSASPPSGDTAASPPPGAAEPRDSARDGPIGQIGHIGQLAVPRGMQILTVPGLHGSGPAHWQSRWEARHPDWQRIEQHDWSRPSLPLWSERVSEGVMRARRVAQGGAVLVAHSFGCLATLRQAALDPVGIAGALLVAPADPDKFGVGALLPTWKLPFPTVLIASRDDPWMVQRTAFSWGALWGSELVDAGTLGHINADSGLGEWAEGKAYLATLLQRIASHGLESDVSGCWESSVEFGCTTPYI